MAKQIAGWLPYGSNDPSVLFRHPLTREVTTAELPYSSRTLNGSGNVPTHHATLGMKAIDSAGAEAGYLFQTPTAVIPDSITNGGQLTIEIQREWLTQNSSDDGTEGFIPSANQSAFKATSSDGLDRLGIEKRTGGTVCGIHAGDLQNKNYFDGTLNTAVTNQLHSEGKEDFITVTMGWSGGTGGITYLGINGLVWQSDARGEVVGSQFSRLYLGSNVGAAGSFMSGHWMRNLQVAARPPVFALHPALAQISALSDSIFDNPSTTPSTTWKDNFAALTIRRVLNRLGLRAGGLTVDENGGYSIGGLGGTQLETRVATILAQNPSLVVINGSINDIQSGTGTTYVGTTFTDEYRDLLEQLFFGVSKNTRTTVQRIYCNLPTPLSKVLQFTAVSANYTDARSRILALPAWWDSTYGPTYGYGRVKTIDIFTAFGASHGAMSDRAISGDGIHLAWKGNRLFGEAIAREIVRNLGV